MRRPGDSQKEKQFRADQEYSKRYKSPLIKWFQQNLSDEDKFRLGLMTYEEYQMWQARLAKEAAEASTGSTFWADDTEERETMSREAYDEFLSQNNVNVSTAGTVDVASLLEELGNPVIPPEPDLEEILANVNRDIHGGSAVLSAEEIAAMFAAANGEEE